jgi:hypothetical protein
VYGSEATPFRLDARRSAIAQLGGMRAPIRIDPPNVVRPRPAGGSEIGFWNIEGSSAYAVVSGSLTVTIEGKPVVRSGTLAYTFGKREGAWKIEAKIWGRTS